MRSIRRAAWLSVVLLLAVVGGYAAWQAYSPATAPPETEGEQATVRSDFELVDHHGRQVTDEDYKGRWQLVFFGFTYCPDICPTTLAAIGRVLDLLGESADQVVPLFITVDPERDTPAVLAEYVAAFHPRIVGLSGTPEQLRQAARSFRVYYGKEMDASAPDGYLMSHSGYIYLMDPSGAYEAVFTENRNTPEEMAADIKRRLGST